MDNTVVADVQPSIVEALGEVEKLPWVSIAFVSSALIWGRLYGLVNAKVLFCTAVFIFDVGTAVCGSAPSIDVLIVGRALCGIGAGGIYTGTMNLILAFTTLKERPVYLGLTGLTWGAGTVLGPVIGGGFASSAATWRLGFYIGLCIGAVAAPIYIFFLPAYDMRAGVPLKQRAAEFDFSGSLLEIGAFLTGVMAISFGGAVYPWRDARIIVLLSLSGVLWIAFALQQVYCISTNSTDRPFPVATLWSWDMVVLFIESAASVTCVFIPIYFIPLHFQFVRDDQPLHAAVRLLPFIFAFVAAALLNGFLMSKTGYYKPWYLVGAGLALTGSALMYTVNKDTSAGPIYGYSILIAFGAGAYNQGSCAVAQAKVRSPSQVPLASALIGFANVLGLTLALTLSNSLFFNLASRAIANTLPTAELAVVQATIAGTKTTLLDGLDPLQRAAVLTDISSAIADVYILTIVGGAISFVFALFMRNEKLFV